MEETIDWKGIEEKISSVLENERNWVANCANISAILWEDLRKYSNFATINWLGFYITCPGKNELVLGPFQGKIACVRIKLGRGVCGKAFADKQTVIVPNVHAFPGHIACDSASESELVCPVLSPAGDVFAVLDIDSTHLSTFSEEHRLHFERISHILAISSDWPSVWV